MPVKHISRVRGCIHRSIRCCSTSASPVQRNAGKSRRDRELREKRKSIDPFVLVNRVKYHNLPDFDASPKEQNREEEELSTYFANLHEHLQRQADSMPAHPESGALEEKTNDPFWVEEEEDWQVLLRRMRKDHPEEVQKNTKNIDELIDFSFLDFKKEKTLPELKNDQEYPQWLWDIAPDREVYSLSDMSRIPFENLTMREKWRILRSWRATLTYMNNAWAYTLGLKNGRVREGYDDPWPEPLTRQDYWGDPGDQDDLYETDDKPFNRQRRRVKKREYDFPKISKRTEGHTYNHIDRTQNMVAFFNKPEKWRGIKRNFNMKGTMQNKNRNGPRNR